MINKSVNIAIDQLSVGYQKGKKKLLVKERINFSANSGELVALIGSNGIGKSTLLRTLSGFQKQLDGKILINGQDLLSFKTKELAKVMSFVSTESVRVQNLRVWELLSIGRFAYTNFIGSLTGEDQKIIQHAIELVGLSGYEDRMIDQISDGERQRVMIARTLVQDTPLIILDEPTAFLDIRNKYEVIHLLHRFAKCENKTIIFSTHDLNVALPEVDKVWLMLDDRVVEGAPEDLIIAGYFEQMFHSERVYFKADSGDFMLRKNVIGSYRLVGKKGLEFIWTKRSMERIGLIENEHEPTIVINIDQFHGHTIWKVQFLSGETLECRSLYDLTAVLSLRLMASSNNQII
jgi:iron complex transport system ATP-binding protein